MAMLAIAAPGCKSSASAAPEPDPPAVQAPPPAAEPAPPVAEGPPSSPPTRGLDEPGVGAVPPEQWPTDPRVIESKRQLAESLGVDPSSIDVVVVEELQWNNGALGCPKPDMAYTQALVPGYRIVLEHGGARHPFHGRDGGEPFPCPSAP